MGDFWVTTCMIGMVNVGDDAHSHCIFILVTSLMTPLTSLSVVGMLAMVVKTGWHRHCCFLFLFLFCVSSWFFHCPSLNELNRCVVFGLVFRIIGSTQLFFMKSQEHTLLLQGP